VGHFDEQSNGIHVRRGVHRIFHTARTQQSPMDWASNSSNFLYGLAGWILGAVQVCPLLGMELTYGII
jgi:hypothetical protein